MTFMLLCLLFPAALLGQHIVANSSSDGRAAVALRRIAAWPSSKATTALIIAILALAALRTLASVASDEKVMLFDDSFISYRYSQHLAEGHGLTWNVGEAPTEGFTNLLLIVLLAPVFWFDGDPLLAARILSALAGLSMAVSIYGISRRQFAASRETAVVLAIAFSISSSTAELSMVGLETVLFAAGLLWAYDLSERYFLDERPGYMLGAGFVGFLSFLLRPEVVFLPVAIVLASGVVDSGRRAQTLRVLKLLAVSFLVPLLVYLAWKKLYFGAILPNPALVKMPGQGLVRPRGLASLRSFFGWHFRVVIAAGLGLILCKGRVRAALACSLLILFYIVFYLRVDTLMDMHDRFIYPLFPFLFIIALPAFKVFVDALLTWQQAPLLRLAVVPLFFMVAVYRDPSAALRRLTGSAHEEAKQVAEREIHQASLVLLRMGEELAKYPKITEVTVGSTDAGLLPFLSRVRHVDMAGLNTRFIAEHKDPKVLADYFFSQHPDLVIVRARIGGALVTYEHGVLGDYTRWNTNPGWDAYDRHGGIHNGPRHDLHFYVRRDGPHAAALIRLISERLTDADVGPILATMGTRSP